MHCLGVSDITKILCLSRAGGWVNAHNEGMEIKIVFNNSKQSTHFNTDNTGQGNCEKNTGLK